MSRFTRFQKIMLALITVCLAFAIATSGRSNIVLDLVYDPLIMLKYSLIDAPIETISNWYKDFNSLWSVKEENDRLRYELSMQEQYSAMLDEKTRALNELETQLNVYQNFEKVYANVINRNPETWNNVITVDVGATDGILKDIAVISGNGLIGKVIDVGQLTSKVRLLTSQDQLSKVSVKISIDENKAVEAILEEYNLEKNSYVVRLFSETDEIGVDMDVVTSGSGGVFPKGVLVGKVNEIVELQNEIGKIVYVTPAVDFNAFNYVAVINKAGD